LRERSGSLVVDELLQRLDDDIEIGARDADGIMTASSTLLPVVERSIC